MRHGTCPKCDGTNVRSGAALMWKRRTLGGNTIPLGGFIPSAVELDNYVCPDCGYVESYVSNRSALARIRAKWPKARMFKAKVVDEA